MIQIKAMEVIGRRKKDYFNELKKGISNYGYKVKITQNEKIRRKKCTPFLSHFNLCLEC
jgi:N-acetyl-anhydromuramyl-L-alanine amidase AmpD